MQNFVRDPQPQSPSYQYAPYPSQPTMDPSADGRTAVNAPRLELAVAAERYQIGSDNGYPLNHQQQDEPLALTALDHINTAMSQTSPPSLPDYTSDCSDASDSSDCSMSMSTPSSPQALRHDSAGNDDYSHSQSQSQSSNLQVAQPQGPQAQLPADDLTTLLNSLDISTLSPEAKRDWADIAHELEQWMPTTDVYGQTVVEGNVGEMRGLLERINVAGRRAVEKEEKEMVKVLEPVAEILWSFVKFWEGIETYQNAFQAFREKLGQM